MTEALQVEATGETVGEAKWSALRELEKLQPGLDKAAVRFQVISEGERGLLGVGYAPARVIASVDATAARPPHQYAARRPASAVYGTFVSPSSSTGSGMVRISQGPAKYAAGPQRITPIPAASNALSAGTIQEPRRFPVRTTRALWTTAGRGRGTI